MAVRLRNKVEPEGLSIPGPEDEWRSLLPEGKPRGLWNINLCSHQGKQDGGSSQS